MNDEHLLRKILEWITEEELLPSGAKLALCVSGGPDSVFLLHAINYLKNAGLLDLKKMIVIHFNHKTRGKDSDKDEDFVKALADKLNTEFVVGSLSVSNNTKLTENYLRNERYKFFQEVANKFEVDYLATGHNYDDQIETIFLNLLRGTGLLGLKGIPPKRLLDSTNNAKPVYIIRPILPIKRAEILDYLEKHNIPYREDYTNRQKKFLRNRLRLEVIPSLREIKPDFEKNIYNLSIYSWNMFKKLNEEAKLSLKKIKYVKRGEYFVIPQTVFENKTVDFIQLLIELIFRNYLSEEIKIRGGTLDRINAALSRKQENHCVAINHNWLLSTECNKLIIFKRKLERMPCCKIEFRNDSKIYVDEFDISLEMSVTENNSEVYETIINNGKKHYAFFDFDRILFPLFLRTWQEADKFCPLGLAGAVKLSRFFINSKIPLYERRCVPILTDSANKIMWVINHRIDERFKVTGDTKRILRVKVNNNESEFNTI